MDQRTCSKCGVTKPETSEFFGKRGNSARGGLRPDCRQCKAEGDRLGHLRNREKRLATAAAYRAAHRAEIAVRDRRYLGTDRGWANRVATNERWRKAHPEVYVMARQKRRAAKLGVGADLTQTEWEACRDAFQHHCAYCGEYRALTQDHVVPLDKGGVHSAGNVIPACKSCNSRKHTSDLLIWYPAQSFFTADRLRRILAHVEVAAAA